MRNFLLRIWIGQGEYAVSSETILAGINKMYKSLGFCDRIGAKSAKSLGVSLAFECGLSDDQVRILGRFVF